MNSKQRYTGDSLNNRFQKEVHIATARKLCVCVCVCMHARVCVCVILGLPVNCCVWQKTNVLLTSSIPNQPEASTAGPRAKSERASGYTRHIVFWLANQNRCVRASRLRSNKAN